MIERRQSFKIAYIGEIAYRMGCIDKKQLLKAAKNYSKNSYGEYLRTIAEGDTNAL